MADRCVHQQYTTGSQMASSREATETRVGRGYASDADQLLNYSVCSKYASSDTLSR